ncbi:hypothetical protein C7212DRAFT_32426, partial [Tuber magnatum]
VNQADQLGLTPVILVSEKGNEVVLWSLPGRGDMNHNFGSHECTTALVNPSVNSYMAMVSILRSCSDINVNSRTAIRASANGHECALRALLSHASVNSNTTNDNDGTPLLLASATGHRGVVVVLPICRDVIPNSPDWYGQTPLAQGSAKFYEQVAKVLLRC